MIDKLEIMSETNFVSHDMQRLVERGGERGRSRILHFWSFIANYSQIFRLLVAGIASPQNF